MKPNSETALQLPADERRRKTSAMDDGYAFRAHDATCGCAHAKLCPGLTHIGWAHAVGDMRPLDAGHGEISAVARDQFVAIGLLSAENIDSEALLGEPNEIGRDLRPADVIGDAVLCDVKNVDHRGVRRGGSRAIALAHATG